MLFDDLDLFILTTILKEKEVTAWSIAKEYQKIGDNTRNEYSLITKRLKRFAKMGLINIEKIEGFMNYQVITDIVKFIPRYNLFKKRCPVICIKQYGKWTIFQT